MNTGWLNLGLVVLTGFAAAPARSAESSVAAELHVPPAETHVWGDEIPLYWRFTNRSPAPLAFLWEGCCRQNGRLTVTRDQREIPGTPPSQALAHMFAKAEVLPPGRTREFDTRLSDWVQLPVTGTYELRGRYTGVLPTQKPMVPRGVELWRAAAETPPLALHLLSVPDYLNERERRSERRGLRLTLDGSPALPPLGAVTWQLRLSNASPVAQTLRWPEDLAIWVLHADGLRNARVPGRIEADATPLVIPPHHELRQTIRFDYTRMEGEPLGDYRVFVDLQAGAQGAPRVPSNPLPLRWAFTAPEVAQLVQQAAQGSRAGLRNPALKLLRVYLGELGPLLDTATLPAAEAKAAGLLAELRLAARLKPFARTPGRVDFAVAPAPNGGWTLMAGQLAWLPSTEPGPAGQLRQVLALRRHLGIDVGVRLEPQGTTSLQDLLAAARTFEPLLEELASPPYIAALPGQTNALGQLQLRTAPSAANVVLRPERRSGGWQLTVARRLPAAGPAGAVALFSPGEMHAAAFEAVRDAAHLQELLRDPRLGTRQVLLLGPAGLTWQELQPLIQPVWAVVPQMECALSPP